MRRCVEVNRRFGLGKRKGKQTIKIKLVVGRQAERAGDIGRGSLAVAILIGVPVLHDVQRSWLQCLPNVERRKRMFNECVLGESRRSRNTGTLDEPMGEWRYRHFHRVRRAFVSTMGFFLLYRLPAGR